MESKNYILTTEQRDTLLSYLYQRPYREVAKGVEMLQGLPDLPPTPPPVEPVKE